MINLPLFYFLLNAHRPQMAIDTLLQTKDELKLVKSSQNLVNLSSLILVRLTFDPSV